MGIPAERECGGSNATAETSADYSKDVFPLECMKSATTKLVNPRRSTRFFALKAPSINEFHAQGHRIDRLFVTYACATRFNTLRSGQRVDWSRLDAQSMSGTPEEIII
jgi:hypothetical protein